MTRRMARRDDTPLAILPNGRVLYESDLRVIARHRWKQVKNLLVGFAVVLAVLVIFAIASVGDMPQ